MESCELIPLDVGQDEAGVLAEAVLEVRGQRSEDEATGPEYPVTAEHGEVQTILTLLLQSESESASQLQIQN